MCLNKCALPDYLSEAGVVAVIIKPAKGVMLC